MPASSTATTNTSATISGFDLAVERSQMSAALEVLRSLCADSATAIDDETCRGIVARLKQAGWLDAAEPIVASVLQGEEVQPWVGGLWSRIQVVREDWNAHRELRSLQAKGAVGEQAVIVWIDELVRQKARVQLLRLASVSEFWIRNTPAAWGGMAAGLRQLHLQKQGHFWVWDWQCLSELTSQDLLHVSEILRSNERDEEGASANLAALERFPNDPRTSVHLCWLAADEVRRGDVTSASLRLQQIDPTGFTPEDRLLHTLVTAALGVAQADAGRLPEVLMDARESVDTACGEVVDLKQMPAHRQLLRDITTPWARLGGLGTKLWVWWRGR